MLARSEAGRCSERGGALARIASYLDARSKAMEVGSSASMEMREQDKWCLDAQAKEAGREGGGGDS